MPDGIVLRGCDERPGGIAPAAAPLRIRIAWLPGGAAVGVPSSPAGG